MNIEYRMATINDLPDIVNLVQRSITHMRQNNIDQWDDLYPAQKDFQNDIKQQQLFIGISKNEIAVVYVLNQECDEAYKNGNWQYPNATFYVIHRLCVNPAFQNQGIARTTMTYIEDQVRTFEGDSIRLDVFSENPHALRLYERCGYHRVGETCWRKGKFYLMEKYLRS